MGRTYRRTVLGCHRIPAALLLGGSALIAALAPWGRAAALFEARPVQAERFAVLARPVGRDDWTLLVLEQLQPAPLCWQSRSDGLVDPSLNRFDFTGICGRFIDSNGYSLRFADGEARRDGSEGLRLRVEAVADELQLQAASPDLSGVLVVGRAPLPARVRDAFVALRLEPGWELRRRSYGSQMLNHLYFSHPTPARQLLALASSAAGGWQLPPPPPPLPSAISSPEGLQPRRSRPPRTIPQARVSAADAWSAQEPQASAAPPGRVIALQVIPFQE
ncbi:MAG: DUF3747 domain-containing protein [Cyanobium sp.]